MCISCLKSVFLYLIIVSVLGTVFAPHNLLGSGVTLTVTIGSGSGGGSTPSATGGVGSATGGSRGTDGIFFIPSLKGLVPTTTPLYPVIPENEALCNLTDLNCDGRINIVDFSILLYWFNRLSPPYRVDFNKDGLVDIIDFSIMAFYWTD